MSVTPPIVASDGTSFDCDTNLAVYEREMGLKELTGKEKQDAPTLPELINRAFRLRGRPREGARALTLTDLATIILGPGWRAIDTRPIAEALTVMGLDRDSGEYLWHPRVTGHTRSSERTLLAASGRGSRRGGWIGPYAGTGCP